jgi:hypothetical protein
MAAALALALALASPAGADGPGDEAREVATRVTRAGAAMFDAEDAKGLAATYLDDARLDVISRDGETGALKVETRKGRAEIQDYYESLFRDDRSGRRRHARNTVEYARLAGPDLLVISGVFEPDAEADDPLKLPFTQVRAREGGAWRIVRLQVMVGSSR